MLSCNNQEYRLLIVKSSLGHELLALNTSRWIVTDRNDCSTSLVSSLKVALRVPRIIGTHTDRLLCNSSLPAFSFKPVLLNTLPHQLHYNFYFGSASNRCHSNQRVTLEVRNSLLSIDGVEKNFKRANRTYAFIDIIKAI
jgi:hypothetical protein